MLTWFVVRFAHHLPATSVARPPLPRAPSPPHTPFVRSLSPCSTCALLTPLCSQFDIDKTQDLDEGQAMQLLEARGEVHTFLELRKEFEIMDADQNRRVNFLEFSTYAFHKSWVDLHTWADAAAYEAAMKAVANAAAKRDAAEAAVKAVKDREDKKAADRAAELEAEAKLTGVAGMACFFKRKAEGTQDETKSNEQIIKEQAALRKQKREAKKAQAEAAALAEEAKKGDPEAAKKKIEEQKAEALAKEEAEAKAKKDAERARRQAFKERMNAGVFGGAAKKDEAKGDDA
jgi:hypothetical protein